MTTDNSTTQQPVSGTQVAQTGMGIGFPELAAAALASNSAWEGGIKDIIAGKGRGEDYANLMLDINPVTAPINMGLRALGMPSVGRRMSTGKSSDQQGRDMSRSTLQGAGLYDKDYNLTLSDGTKVNMGLDGSVKNYNIDFNQEGIDGIVASVNPLAYLIANGDKKRASDLAGEFTNAIRNSKDPQAEAKRLYEQLKISKTEADAAFTKMGLDDATKKIFLGTFDALGIKDPQQVANQANSDAVAQAQASSRAFRDKIAAASRQQANDAKQAQQQSQRSAILNNLLSKASTAGQNINYPKPNTGGFLSRVAAPVQQPQVKTPQLSGALNKILGG